MSSHEFNRLLASVDEFLELNSLQFVRMDEIWELLEQVEDIDKRFKIAHKISHTLQQDIETLKNTFQEINPSDLFERIMRLIVMRSEEYDNKNAVVTGELDFLSFINLFNHTFLVRLSEYYCGDEGGVLNDHLLEMQIENGGVFSNEEGIRQTNIELVKVIKAMSEKF